MFNMACQYAMLFKYHIVRVGYIVSYRIAWQAFWQLLLSQGEKQKKEKEKNSLAKQK